MKFSTTERLFCLTILLATLESFLYAQPPSSWQPIGGPFRGHAVSDIAVCATRMYASDTDTLKVSTDGGINWTYSNGQTIPPTETVNPVAVACVCTSPLTAILARNHTGGVNDGVYRTTDGGVTWVAASGLSAANADFQPQRLYISPLNSNLVFLGTDKVANQPSLWRSTDNGITWLGINDFNPNPNYNTYINDILVYPANGAVFVAGSYSDLLDPPPPEGGRSIMSVNSDDRGIWRSTDNGLTWPGNSSWMSYFLSNERSITSLTASYDVTNSRWLIYAATESGVPEGESNTTDIYVSTDNGDTWTKKASNPAGVHSIRALRASPGPNNTYQNPLLAAATDDGLFVSYDRGTTWTLLSTQFFGASKNMYQAMFDPNDAAGNTLVVATGAGVYTGVYQGNGNWQWTSSMTGIAATNGLKVASSGGTVYAVSSFTNEVYKYSGGAWSSIKSIKGFKGSAIAVSKTNPSYVYIGGSLNTNQYARLYYSSDAGNSWSTSKVTLSNSNTKITTIVPDTRGSSAYVYAGIGGTSSTYSYNYAVTTNMGYSWSKKLIGGISGKPVNAIVPNTSSGTGSNSATVFAGLGATQGLWQSIDGGITFSFYALSMTSVNDLAFNSSNSTVVRMMYEADGDAPGGVSKSTNYGADWINLEGAPHSGAFVLMDPFQDPSQAASTNFVYLLGGSNPQSFKKTTDGGIEWISADYPAGASSLDDLIADIAYTGPNAVMYGAASTGVFKGVPPASAPGSLQPEQSASICCPGMVNFSWGTVPYATKYHLKVTNTTTSTVVVDVVQTGTSYPYTFGSCGAYNFSWDVSAVNLFGEGPKATQTFASIIGPGAFSLSSPADHATGILSTSVNLTWGAAAYASSYTVYISENSNFSPLTVSPAPTTANPSYTFNAVGCSKHYYWKVTATNTCGTTASTQVYRDFYSITAPGSFSLYAPANHATNIPCSASLQWVGSPFASSYTVYISENTSFTPLTISPPPTTTATTYNFTTVGTSKHYYWKVLATNACGTLFSGTDPYWDFSSITGIPATPPASLSPFDGQTGVGCSPTLSWSPVPGACQYHVFVPNKVNQYVSSTSFLLSGLSVNTQYTYSVYATNPFGDGPTASASFTTAASCGGGGCCPYVFSFDGSQFIAENNVLPQSEYPGNLGNNVTDYYKLLKPMEAKDGRYLVDIREFEHERSTLDMFQLLAVDHEASNDIAVLPSGEIVQYVSPFFLEKGASEDAANLASVLSRFDGSSFEPSVASELRLSFRSSSNSFAAISGTSGGGILLGGWVGHDYRETQCVIKPQKVGAVASDNTLVGSPVPFTFRERPTLVFVPLERLEHTVRIQFGQRVAIDYAQLVAKVPRTYTLRNLKLVSAVHSIDGDVLGDVMKNDARYSVLIPGQSIGLQFEAPPLASDLKRDFVLVSHGRYLQGTAANPPVAVREYQLQQNFPNPFNPVTTLKYALPAESKVRLSIYNTLGQRMTTLVNEVQPAGYRTVEWDASTAASGVYYYRIEATSLEDPASTFRDVKKMVLVK